MYSFTLRQREVMFFCRSCFVEDCGQMEALKPVQHVWAGTVYRSRSVFVNTRNHHFTVNLRETIGLPTTVVLICVPWTRRMNLGLRLEAGK